MAASGATRLSGRFSEGLLLRRSHSREVEGDTIIVRYADDFVVGFQHKRDAESFLSAVKERFGSFELELHPDKTRLIEFGRFAITRRRQRGQGRPETFDFLGFTHYCTETRRGRFQLGRKAVAKRMARTLKRIKEALYAGGCMTASRKRRNGWGRWSMDG